ncbi:lysosomal/endosomal membrane protein p67, putative [Bodo saltans]|uniref:Phospholipase B-like n=1 Tax=Bodo saltans TaxID=75058 RepID=A0A0S4JCU5_BODSA|nr:lysosomal/endosomal membrane protein p67, putative [Bodo saltans]|eukprot:CUG87850.1 lysosomal/endosomal membrane protein p67, putative [Bodo saltans]
MHPMMAIIAVALLTSAALAAEFAVPPQNLFTAFYRNELTDAVEAGFTLTPDSSRPCASIAVHNLGVNATGWDAVYVTVPAEFADSDNATVVAQGYYCAGYAEGYSTGARILQQHWNMEITDEWNDAIPETRMWINNHTAYMDAQVAANPTDSYWQQVGNFLTQLKGMHAGYTAWADGQLPSANTTPLEFLDIFLINFVFEFYDVATAMEVLYPPTMRSLVPSAAGSGVSLTPRTERGRRVYGSHCSALIKKTDDGDLIMSHNTWSTFESMLRQYKTYVFGSAYSVSFSSYPGTIHSGDDFYVLGSDFTVQETTNENNNPVTTAPYVDALAVSEFIRVMVSNRFATNGSHWADLFCSYNTGTYNNQWMVVDMAKFTLSMGTVTNDTLWIIEQMPNMCKKGDQSAILESAGYWASYNRPFYADVFAWGGFLAHEQEYGTLFSYADNYRANIFRRNESRVTSVETMKDLMRYNDYLHDPFSIVPNCTNCSPVYSPYLSIACRADLVPRNASYGVMDQFIGQYDTAAIDAKIISASLMRQPTVSPWIISSPTYGGSSNIPPFRFSTSLYNQSRHQGIPDTMNFDWLQSDAAFNGAPSVNPNAATADIGSLSVHYSTTNYSNTNFAESLYYLFVSVCAMRGAPLPSRELILAMTQVQVSSRYGFNLYVVPFHFIAVDQPAAAPAPAPVNATHLLAVGAAASVGFSVQDAYNALLFASDAELSTVGISSVTYTTTTTTDPDETPHKWTWILGTCVGGVALVALIVVVIRRKVGGGGYEHVREDGDLSAMNKFDQA